MSVHANRLGRWSSVFLAGIGAGYVFALAWGVAVYGLDEPEPPAWRALFVCGVLCLLGTVGPVVGDMRLQLVGVAGYAVLLPVAAFLLARVFAGSKAR